MCVCPGVTPRSGWAVDPFGHSPSMTYILKGAGLKDMVIQRVHYAVKKHFAKQRTLEFAWRQSWGEAHTPDQTGSRLVPPASDWKHYNKQYGCIRILLVFSTQTSNISGDTRI